MRVPKRPHRPWAVVVPLVAQLLQPLPLDESALQPHLVFVRRRLLEPRRVGPEIGDLGHDVKHHARPLLLFTTAVTTLHNRIHVTRIQPPQVRIPRGLPVERQAAQHLHPDIQPEARPAHPRGLGVPPALPDERPRARDVVHALRRPLAHNLVHVEHHRRGRALGRVPVRVPQALQQQSRGGVVVEQRPLVIARRRFHERQVFDPTGEERVEQHRRPERPVRYHVGKVLVPVQTVHPDGHLVDEDLHQHHLALPAEVVALAAHGPLARRGHEAGPVGRGPPTAVAGSLTSRREAVMLRQRARYVRDQGRRYARGIAAPVAVPPLISTGNDAAVFGQAVVLVVMMVVTIL